MTTLKLVVVSATGLKNVHLMSKMNPFVVVSVAGLPTPRPRHIKTPIDHKGGRNPVWSYYLELDVPELSELHQNRFTLVFQIFTLSHVFGNREIGKVVVPVKKLLDDCSGSEVSAVTTMIRTVTTPSGKLQGELTFSYEFSDAALTSSIPERATVENENMGNIHAPTTHGSNFLASGCIAEFFPRICGSVVGNVLSESF